ncbi:MAG: PQ-loop repeat-containing protein [Candidatus Dependentiae bacterium]|jgi:hypothetical protein
MHQFLIPEILAWIPALVYFSAPWMQALKNFFRGTAQAVSHPMLFIASVGSVARLLFVFFLWLPLAYRCVRPLTLAALFFLVFQSYWYTEDAPLRRRIIIAYTALASVTAALVLWGIWMPSLIGHGAGWVSFVAFSVHQVPQMWKNYRRKSVEGLSFAYLTLLCIGATLEIVIALIMGLPIQSVLNGLRGVAYYSVFCYQFVHYSKESDDVMLAE